MKCSPRSLSNVSARSQLGSSNTLPSKWRSLAQVSNYAFLSFTREPRRAEFLLNSVTRVIEAILEKPIVEVGCIGILGDQERAFLTSKHDVEDVPEHLSLLYSRFELSAQLDPAKIAIDWDSSKNITYKDLNEQADRMAAYLSHQNIGSGDIIPLYLDSSIATIVAILGTLKAGAAYVPLNPDNPMDRNIVKDVGGQMVLNQSDYQDVGQDQVLQVVNVADVVSSQDVPTAPLIDHSPEDIAYVIYTNECQRCIAFEFSRSVILLHAYVEPRLFTYW